MSLKERLKSIVGSDSRIVGGMARQAYSIFIRSKMVYIIRYRPYMDDEKYIKRLYKKRLGVGLNLTNPQTFNEKNNWRKIHDRQDSYTDMVDKYKLKQVVEKLCGVGYTIPIIGAWDKPEDIEFDALPEKFILKPNHAGGVIICREKATFERNKAVNELRQSLCLDYFSMSREWPYKNVKRKVICEQYMGENLTDFKNYCFNGRMTYTFVWKNKSREDGRKPATYFCGAYDRDWKKTEIDIDYPSAEDNCEKPDCYDEMVKVAEKMSAGIPFVRVDCFIIDNHVYVGEMTFFPWGGFQKFKDPKWDAMLGDMEKLPGLDS